MTTNGGNGCTVGIVHLPGGILFFKNRDLSGENLARGVTVWESTSEVHALRGMNLKTGELEGVSIGVNRHRICVANTNVVSTEDVTYDLLCERLVHEAREKGDVPRITRNFMAGHRVQGGRILVASPDWTYLLEVLGDRYEIQAREGNLAITNTFSLLPATVDRPEIREQSSASRLQVANRAIEAISSSSQLKSLLRSHLPEKGELSICNHRLDGGGTESSHILHLQGEYAGWWSLSGFPCQNDYRVVQLFQGNVQPTTA